MSKKRVYELVLDDGDCPIDDWLASIRDTTTRARIVRQIDRIGRGALGDHKFFDGIAELRLDFGPGYRVYFISHGAEIVLLLGGGDKKTQQQDITLAKKRRDDWEKQGKRVDPFPSWGEPEDDEDAPEDHQSGDAPSADENP